MTNRLEPDRGDLLEKLAEAAHELFCDSLRAKGYRYGAETSAEERLHSSLKPYAELPEDEKEQNRNNVRDIARKLAATGYTIVPSQGNQASKRLSDDEVEELAEMEHARWMRQKLDSGWRHAKTTDKARKLHKDLVPWNQLTREEKDKDRVLVRGIPEILARAGYKMVKASQQPQES